MPMNNSQNIRIASIGTANPSVTLTQNAMDAILTHYYSEVLKPRTLDIMHKLLAHPSIKKRHIAVDTPEQIPSIRNEDPDERIKRFTHWATELSRKAVIDAILKAHVQMEDVRILIVNTCTGYLCPGISTYLCQALGLPATTLAYDLVGSGCGGAIPNLQLASNCLAGIDNGVVVSVSVEICSATFQISDDMSLILSNALFGDGAAAAVLWKEPIGLKICSSESRIEPDYRDYVRFTHKNGQLHNMLSPKLPGVIRKVVPELIRNLLLSDGLLPMDITYWAVHPGGDRIIGEIKDGLGLTDEQLLTTYSVLSEYGNMSSPTVLFELDRIMQMEHVPGTLSLMTAFGAGLSAHAMLLSA